MTVGAIVAEYLADRTPVVAAPAYLTYSWRALEPHFADTFPETITQGVCERYQKARTRDGVKPGTTRNELGVLRTALVWAERKGWLTKAPYIWRPGSQPARERHLSRDEAAKLLGAVEKHHLRLFVMLGLYTGGRAGAILSLTWDRVDFDRRRVYFRIGNEKVRQKGRATVPINDRLLPALIEAKKGATTDYVVEYAGGPVKSVGVGIRRAAKRAGLGSIGPHVLRHTAAVWMAEKGVPLEAIAAYLGHKSTAVTSKHYAQFQPDFLLAASRALE